ncbi:translesion error-prone DNA polymerase V subunit UmuC [Hafnia paralvei]|nr:translesion error-prone DNA polymerase V subunit UmuC [Hafnia paralvei]AJQ98822.1 Error-prone, lesion bypass DNA polymerase V (UmuC) [Enterobacteriaceae bacterium bta3-1]
MFALVDVNSFYASCEAAFRPDLNGKPIVVLSNNDGCVIARSAEAKRLGIKMGEPYFKQKQLFEQYGVHVFSSNYSLYGDMSQRVMQLLDAMAPRVEVYSIDEAFMDLHGVSHCRSLEEFGREVREIIKLSTHLTVGVGIAPTKTLAKLANHAAKQWPKTGGVVDLSNELRQRKLMAIMPVEEVWGVGRRLSKSLRSTGIDTVLKLADMDLAYVRRNYTVVLERTVRELRGESCLDIEEVAPIKQQIVCSRSFGERITEYQDMKEAICSYAERAAEKLRGERQFCKHVSTFIKTSPFAERELYYSNLASSRLEIPTNDTRDIIKHALSCLDKIWQPGNRYQKAGIMLGDFYDKGVSQLNLFDELGPKPNSEALMKVLDEINNKGRGKIWFAGQGIMKGWQMKRNMLSPAYTTRFSEIPTAFAK